MLAMTCLLDVECEFDTTLCSFSCSFGYEVDNNNCPVSCLCAAETSNFEGDIQISTESLPMFMKVH